MPDPPAPISKLSRRLARRWAMAALAGVAVSELVVMRATAMRLDPFVVASAGLGIGSMVIAATAPWRLHAALSRRGRLLHRLTNRIRRLGGDRRGGALSDIVIDRPDEIGALSRAVHEALRVSVADRVRATSLQKTMTHTIRSETDRATARLRRQAATDALTGLGNRRALRHLLGELLGVSGPARPVTAMVIDVDHFKPVNDTLGHDVGDRCLVFLGDLIRSILGEEDAGIRVGGDEFVVLLPGRTASETRAVADRIRTLFAQMPWPHRQVGRPSLSIGIAATSSATSIPGEELIRRADQALYASKRAGRARVSIGEQV